MEQLNMFGCPSAYRSNRITRQTRRESYEKTDGRNIKKLILDQLAYGDMTAREVAAVLYRHGLVPTSERQQVQPRMNDLQNDGLIEVVGKRLDSVTKRRVAVYRLIKD
uniref:Dissimilatory sulfite reductase D n=1 Tax=Siphoviridae sp. ctX926 TaxID=2826366 RepID=A0A8S5M1M0_9CAUD|nr:MAG TPA: dissimilatory sulfite reductase D [Siphoviridae sp. ctX926]